MEVNKPTPFFSIIVPAYNRAELVRVTVHSVLSQTYPHFELILVDDGSTDNTLAILKTFESEKVKVLHKINGERGAARNYGARHAKGNYLVFFDSDDIMYSHHLQTVADDLVKNNLPEVAYVPFEFVDPDGKFLSKVFIDNTNWKYKIVRDNFLGCDSVIIRKDIFEQFWFNEDRRFAMSEDKELWLRVSGRYKFHFIPVVGLAMIQHPGRSMNSFAAENLEYSSSMFVKVLTNDVAFMQAFGSKAKFLFAYEFALVSSYWSAAGNKGKGRKYLQRSFAYYPLIVFNKRFLAALKNYFLR